MLWQGSPLKIFEWITGGKGLRPTLSLETKVCIVLKAKNGRCVEKENLPIFKCCVQVLYMAWFPYSLHLNWINTSFTQVHCSDKMSAIYYQHKRQKTFLKWLGIMFRKAVWA
jgi:hypothetical protein